MPEMIAKTKITQLKKKDLNNFSSSSSFVKYISKSFQIESEVSASSFAKTITIAILKIMHPNEKIDSNKYVYLA